MTDKPIEQKILDELLEGEFKKLKKQRVRLKWMDYYEYVQPPIMTSDTMGNTWPQSPIAWINRVEEKEKNIIFLNKAFMFSLRIRINETKLKNVLRHELLHIEMGYVKDKNKEFQKMAIERGIPLTIDLL